MSGMASAGGCVRRTWLASRSLGRIVPASASARSRWVQACPALITRHDRRATTGLARQAQRPINALAAGEAADSQVEDDITGLQQGERWPVWQVEKISNNARTDSVDLTWGSGEVTQFPYVWLRDCCLCPHCYHPTTLSRRLRIDQLDVNIKPISLQNDLNSQEVLITWPGGHQSRFPYCWLAERSFTPGRLKERQNKEAEPKSLLWDRHTIQQNLFKTDFAGLMSDTRTLRDTLHQLQAFGVLVVRNCPTQFGVVEQLTSRLGHAKLTHYGKTFRVTTVANANNLAYTSETLPLHIDLPFYEYVPGVQLLHCISQHVGSGGENTLADSFYVVELIRQQRPDLFQLLVTTLIEFDDVDNNSGFHKIHEHPMISLDEEGNTTQVCFNNAVRSYRLNVPFELVKPMYEGLKMFHDLCSKKENHLLYKMENGDTLVFNNRRVMHGRLGYTATEDGERTLEGSYIDWDEITCRYRTVTSLLRRADAVQ